MKIRKKYRIYVSKKRCEDKHVDLLLIEEKGKRLYTLIKDLNAFMYSHTLYLGKKTFLPLLFTSFQYRRNIKTSY